VSSRPLERTSEKRDPETILTLTLSPDEVELIAARVAARATRLALSPDEAAAALGCSRDHLDEHISHELRWVRRGRRKFVPVRELERWLELNASKAVG
jgi:excisionase family DNA binding protein